MANENNHLWLPYTQHKTAAPPLQVVDANGCKIILSDGRKLLDGVSNWWTACHGHKHPHLLTALHAQAEHLPHVMFAGLVHEQAQTLSQRLAKLTQLPRVFFSDSGSVAVEIAMKMAVQFWRNKNPNSKKQKFLHFTNSYHGDTMGAMSVSDTGFDKPYYGHFPLQFKVDIPLDELAFNDLEQLIDISHSQLAGVIIEPLVQAAGGMKFHSPDILAEIHRVCKKFDLLFIADEIATGFGRTGYMFASQEAGILSDIMCIGKALGGGITTISATCASAQVFEGFLHDEFSHAFMHGPTYMANPIACAVANAGLDLFESEPRLQQVQQIEEWLQAALEPLRTHANVADIRIKGALGVVELQQANVPELRAKLVEQGAWLRPFGNIIYIAPPFTISQNELNKLCAAIAAVI